MPSAPSPLRAAAPLPEGPGCPAEAGGGSHRLSRGRISPPAPGRAAPPWGSRSSKTQTVRERCTAARRSGLGAERGTKARWVPAAADAGVGLSVSLAFSSPVPRRTLPRLARVLSLQARPIDPWRGPSASKGSLSQRPVRFPSSSLILVFGSLQSWTPGPPTPTTASHSKSGQARFSATDPHRCPRTPFPDLMVL